ncbi:MAG: D-glycero-alpha-D-manno-heptose-1,7-bisphosphate 7-phosphatase [Oligoflexales bacterium]
MKAVFFDKDGTLIPDIPYNTDVTRITFTLYVETALERLTKLGYKLFIITNQPGLAFGRCEERHLKLVEGKLARMFRANGVRLAGFYYCPHHPDGIVSRYALDCECRKPLPGLLYKAAADFGIDLHRSWMVGDILNDVEAGNRAGCKTILLNNGNETEWLKGPHRSPDYIADNFLTIGEIIATQSNRRNLHFVHPTQEARYDHR